MAAESTTPEPREIFRSNLRRLAAAQRMGFEELASALGVVRGEKKWLRKVWRDGLARCDQRTLPLLNRLGSCLGLSEAAKLWKPDVVVQPEEVLRSNIDAWIELVRKVRDYLESLQTLRARFPAAMLDIEASYEFQQHLMIAIWVGRNYLKLPPDEGASQFLKLEQMLVDTEADREYQMSTSVRDRVFERVKDSAEWPLMFRHLLKLFDEDETWHDQVDRELEHRMTEAMSRQPSADEVFARFHERYLAPYRAFADRRSDEASSEIDRLLSELKTHRNWRKHLKQHFDDDKDAARSEISRLWNEYREATGNACSMGTFASFYRSRRLDTVLGPEVNGRWKMKPVSQD